MKYLLCFIMLFHQLYAFSQNRMADSLNALLVKTNSDTGRITLMNAICSNLQTINLDSSINMAERIVLIARSKHYPQGEAEAHRIMAAALSFKSKFAEAKEQLLMADRLYQAAHDTTGQGRVYSTYGVYYGIQSKYDSSTFYFKKSIPFTEHLADQSIVTTAYQNIAVNYQQQADFEQALAYYQKALNIADKMNDDVNMGYIFLNMSLVYDQLNDKNRVEEYLLKAINYAKKAGIFNVEQYAYANLAALYDEKEDYKQSYDYAMKAFELGKTTGDQGITSSSLSRASLALANENKFEEAEKFNARAILIADSSGVPLNKFQTLSDAGYIRKKQKQYEEAIPFYEKGFLMLKDADIYTKEIGIVYQNLSECYKETGNYEKALTNFKLSAQISDSLKNRENVRKATELSMNYDFEKKQQLQRIEKEKEDRENEIKLIFLVVILLVFITLSTVALFAYKREQKAKALVNAQKKEVESTLAELKITQAQLIQSEKMASLGELTAGIAHEIQNPLNFVNNFSELNNEMLSEMKEEIEKGNYEEVKLLANDIEANEQKITHHGKRADAIVKGMLQHSRKNAGIKEATDINLLCDEYLRLSYHGVRSKDRSCHVDLKTDFDKAIGKINVVPQDIGRVLLNLFNNAFYAVNEKKKTAGEGYQPLIFVQTKTTGDKIEIVVKDNGNGIPQRIIDKIFQPFFTTKPTGEGTGLGLSLSYDIITKEHNGILQAESKEGEGSSFIITLPS